VGVVVVAAAVPLGDGVREAAKALDVDPVRLALAGGDDYELLIAVHPHDVSVLVEAVAPTPLSVVGEFSEGDAGIVEWPDGSREPLRGLGWDGFA
jgi:thiamine-monophosphate kinase